MHLVSSLGVLGVQYTCRSSLDFKDRIILFIQVDSLDDDVDSVVLGRA